MTQPSSPRAASGPGEDDTQVLPVSGSASDRPPGRPARAPVRPERAAARSARRRARLALTRVDPWSVFLLSLILSVFLGVVLLVAVGALYALLSNLGVLSTLDTFASELELIDDGQQLLSSSRVLGVAAVVAAIDVVLLTVLGTLFAFLYNLCASLTGGVEVTLSERE